MDKPWLNFYKDVPEFIEIPDLTLYEALVETEKKYPNHAAIEYMGSSFSFSRFVKEVDLCAAALSKCGVKKGDGVTLSLPNMPAAVILFYAINKIGAVAVMTHPLSSPSELEHYIKSTNSVFAVTVDMFYGRIKKAAENASIKKVLVTSISDYLNPVMKALFKLTKGRSIKKVPKSDDVIFWNDFLKTGKGSEEKYVRSIQPDHSAVVLFSGGTSDMPKGIMLSSKNFNALAYEMEPITNFLPGDKVLAILPIFHGFGLGLCVHTAFIVGGCSILVPSFSAKLYIQNLKKHKPQFIAGVPTLFESLLRNSDFKKVTFERLKGAYSGGDSLSPDIKERFDKALFAQGSKVELAEGYGVTESVTACVVSPIGAYKPNATGIAIPNTMVKIVDVDTTNSLPYGKEGEICVAGPTLMVGYLNEPNATAETLKVHEDGITWLHTGDLGYMDSDGYVFFKSRLKRIIKVSGMAVFPTQIERVLQGHHLVENACVVGVPDSYQVTSVKAFIVLKDKSKASEETKAEIIKYCKTEMIKWNVPKYIEFIDELPKTLVGKVAYTKLG